MSAGRTAPPSSISGAVVTASVPCRRCGYDQRGLATDGVCPECGLETWASVRAAIDPAARRLPKLTDPVGVARALVWLTACELVATLLFAARPLAVRIDQLDASGLRAWSAWTPGWLVTAAGIVAMLGLWSVWKLAPPRHQRADVPRALTPLGLGLAGFGVIAMLAGLDVFDPGFARPSNALERQIRLVTAPNLAMGAFAILNFVGLRLVLQTIGQRSREYRTAKGGRQRVRDIMAAIAGAMVGESMRVAGLLADADALVVLGRVVIWICMLMLLIGQAYLVLNAWWIRRALRKPRPALRDILGPAPVTGRVVHPARGIIEAESTDGTERPPERSV